MIFGVEEFPGRLHLFAQQRPPGLPPSFVISVLPTYLRCSVCLFPSALLLLISSQYLLPPKQRQAGSFQTHGVNNASSASTTLSRYEKEHLGPATPLGSALASRARWTGLGMTAPVCTVRQGSLSFPHRPPMSCPTCTRIGKPHRVSSSGVSGILYV